MGNNVRGYLTKKAMTGEGPEVHSEACTRICHAEESMMAKRELRRTHPEARAEPARRSTDAAWPRFSGSLPPKTMRSGADVFRRRAVCAATDWDAVRGAKAAQAYAE